MTLHALLVAACFADSFVAAQPQAPADAPAGTTVQCKDGTLPVPTPSRTRAAVTKASKRDSAKLPAPRRQGLGNDESKVYHCMGDRYHGKTKKGNYLSEADAKAKGMHASHKQACSQGNPPPKQKARVVQAFLLE